MLQRIGKVLDTAIQSLLWKCLNPATTSQTGLPITLSSQSDWEVFSEIWVSGEYDRTILKALQTAKPGVPFRVLDLGANVGLFSLRCIELRNLHAPAQPLSIVAVEGVAQTFRILSRNLSAQKNDITAVDLHHGLVGQRTGSASIYSTSHSGSNTVVPPDGKVSLLPFRGAHAVMGQWLDLETVLPTGPIDLVKCDIEGSEAAFLKNYPDLLHRTQNMVIEIHPQHADLSKCRDMVIAAGLKREETLRSNPHMVLETYLRPTDLKAAF
jgi:FkbM family methyltransferase